MQVSKLFMPEIEEAITNNDLKSISSIFSDLHPSDIAEVIQHLSPEQISTVIQNLEVQQQLDVFVNLDVSMQADVLLRLTKKEKARILEEMSPDDRVDVLQELPDETVDSLLPLMAQAEREDVRKLLQYGENTAGAIMTTEYAALSMDMNVSEALQRLRTIAPDSETIYVVYITDSERHLLGTVSLRELVLARPTQKIESFVSMDPIFVRVDTDQEEVAKAFKKYDFLAIPVVDDQNRLVGIVTYDDAMDVLEEEETEDVHMMGAVGSVEQPYFVTGFWHLAKQRGLWLLMLLFGGFFSASALRHFEGTLEQALALVFFVPLIVSAGGNTGSQSVTLITRGLAVGDVKLRDFLRVAFRESSMGLTLGIFLGLIGILYAFQSHSPWSICLAVGLALCFVVLMGAVLGALLPLFFKRLGFDPALMSAPFVASIVDVLGIIVYFTVAGFLVS